jgi:hypothetical protein
MESVIRIHKLFLQNVKEENEKEKNEPNSVFNTKRNLISIAKETLKPKNLKYYNIDDDDYNNSYKPVKVKKIKGKRNNKLSPKHENIRRNLILSDKDYLSFLLNDLKSISSRNKNNSPSYSNNISFLSKQKGSKYSEYNSNDETKNNININIYNPNINQYNDKNNCNMVDLLNQVVGDKYSKNNYKYEANITENNNYFDNLCYDNEENKFVIREKMDYI